MSTIKAIDSRRSILVDSLSVPKTIGKGPIITAPPPRGGKKHEDDSNKGYEKTDEN
jgi:hypothetical protein